MAKRQRRTPPPRPSTKELADFIANWSPSGCAGAAVGRSLPPDTVEGLAGAIDRFAPGVEEYEAINWATDWLYDNGHTRAASALVEAYWGLPPEEVGYTRRWRVEYDLAYDGGGSAWTAYYRTRLGAVLARWWHYYLASWGGTAVVTDMRAQRHG